MKKRYCVTARNRLTGKREIITRPLETKEEAENIKLNLYNRIGGKKPYTYAKVEVYVRQEDLFTNKKN